MSMTAKDIGAIASVIESTTGDNLALRAWQALELDHYFRSIDSDFDSERWLKLCRCKEPFIHKARERYQL